MLIDNLKGDELGPVVRRLRVGETATPLGNTSISSGRLRVASAEGFVVEGSETISGTSSITGTQNVSGTSNINGTQNINGTLIVGSITITPTGAYGATIAASTLFLDSSFIEAPGALFVHGEVVASDGMSVLGMPTTTNPANIYTSAIGGEFHKVTSAAKYKIDAQEMDLPDELLAVPVEWWIDRNNAERFASLYDAPRPFTRAQQMAFEDASLGRVPGVIAEKVAAAGGDAFVSYAPDGEIEGVAYDRLALARTAILARKLEDALAKIDELTKRLDAQ